MTMTPRTRSSNRDADFKVYYAKKVPQQVHFPHKRKTVRRPSPPMRRDTGKRQMVFLPDKMKIKSAGSIRDSDEESEATDLEVETRGKDAQIEDQSTHWAAPAAEERSKKRTSDTNQRVGNDEKESIIPTSKRRRRTAVTVKTERTMRRQSTMTQLVDGRRPLSDDDEPEFKSLKRSSRVSWSGKGQSKSKDKQQRTLTQMIPGMRPLEITSDDDLQDSLSDLEAQESDGQAYDSAVARRLAVQGDYADADAEIIVKKEAENAEQFITHFDDEGELPAVVVQSVETATNGEGEESYRPTQYIDAPSSRPGRTDLRSIKIDPDVTSVNPTMSPDDRTAQKASFGLLRTPEKRRIRVIPSSQSPADTPLSTQVSPQKLHRSPLHERLKTPTPAPSTSSRRKRVVFKDPSAPPNLKKFESTIQDSEDEDEVIEDSSPISNSLRGCTKPSPELGDVCTHTGISQENIPDEQIHRLTPRPSNGSEAGSQARPTCSRPLTCTQELDEAAIISTEELFPNLAEILRSTPPSNEMEHQETFPSTPMVIQDDSSNEDSQEDPTPPQRIRPINLQPNSIDQQQTADLDGEPIQVPRSPSAQHATQQSHSSKAEQQLQREWFSYSQYVNARPPTTSSSMHVMHDASSYGHGITQSAQRTIAPPAQSAAPPPVSQATTLDEVTQRTPRTPRKSETLHLASATTTPHRIASSQPATSPSKLPPLFIPSSFPSPSKAAMQGWSSPAYGRTQDLFQSSQFGMSLEDFSIPPPPPPADDDWTHEE